LFAGGSLKEEQTPFFVKKKIELGGRLKVEIYSLFYGVKSRTVALREMNLD
jgi:hypothetical protein